MSNSAWQTMTLSTRPRQVAMRCSLGMRRLNPIVKQDEELWICSHRHHTRLFIYLIQVVSTAYSSSSGSIDHAGSVFRAFSSKNTRAGLETAPSSRIKEISVFSKIIVTVWYTVFGSRPKVVGTSKYSTFGFSCSVGNTKRRLCYDTVRT